MATWIVGDIHGCAAELHELLADLQLGATDTFVSVGDLFHRGPDPVGVMELLQSIDAPFLLGNHEHAVLDRFDLAPGTVDPTDRPGLRTEFGDLPEDCLAGDGRMPCDVLPERRGDILRFLQTHRGYYLEHADIPGAGTTKDGRPWCAVHAGLVPGKSPASSNPEELMRLRRLPRRGNPFWYEIYGGPNLVLFGHTPSSVPRQRRNEGRLVALGLDTGCVYGGKLTAYSPELDEYAQVAAARAYADQGRRTLN